MGNKLVRIRLGSGLDDGKKLSRERKAFTRTPYDISHGRKALRASPRPGRGASSLPSSAASLRIFQTQEKLSFPRAARALSGQVSSPSVRRARITAAILCSPGAWRRFLKRYLDTTSATNFRKYGTRKQRRCDNSWTNVKVLPGSRRVHAGKQNRQSSVDKKWRHCGICAACMLRRLSVHAAGLKEKKETYVWEDLSAKTFKAGAASGFKESKITPAMREYAIAGALYLDHLAGILDSPANAPKLDLTAYQPC